MPLGLKKLGGVAGGGGDTSVYKAPSNSQVEVTVVMVMNKAATSATYRIAVTSGATPTDPGDFIAYDLVVEANDTVPFPGFLMAAGESLFVNGSAATVIFTAFGKVRD